MTTTEEILHNLEERKERTEEIVNDTPPISWHQLQNQLAIMSALSHLLQQSKKEEAPDSPPQRTREIGRIGHIF